MTEIEDRTSGRSRKGLAEAVLAFQTQPRELTSETRRKCKLTLTYLNDFCEKEGVRYVDQAGIDVLDRYALWRNKTNWTWIQEVEILRQFFGFCMDREWTTRNPAKALKRPRLLEANDVEPFTTAAIIRIIAACAQIGRARYERLRARAMVLLMRYAGLRNFEAPRPCAGLARGA